MCFQARITMVSAVVVLFSISAWSATDPPTGAEAERAPLEAILALNYLSESLANIIQYNDRLVLDREYSKIINNLNLNKIPDEDIMLQHAQLLGLLHKHILSADEREMLEKEHGKNLDSALKSAFSGAASGIRFTGEPYSTILSVVASCGAATMNYQQQREALKDLHEKEIFKLEAGVRDELTKFRQSFLMLSWNTLKNYGIEDSWRITEKQFDNYLEILKDANLVRRSERLQVVESQFQKYPPYWYYRGRTNQDIYESASDAEQYKAGALDCYDRYEGMQEYVCLRADSYAASVAMSRIVLLGKDATPDQILKDLQTIIKNSEDSDWGNILFAALQYARLGKVQEARNLLIRNINNGYEVCLGASVTVETLLVPTLPSMTPEKINDVLEATLKNNTIKNYDILNLYGKMRNQDILRKISNEFEPIVIYPERRAYYNPARLWNNDRLVLVLTPRWQAENVSSYMKVMVVGSDQSVKTEVKNPEVRMLGEDTEARELVFDDVLSVKDIIRSEKGVSISVFLERPVLTHDRAEDKTYEIELRFVSEIVESKDVVSKFEKHAFPALAFLVGAPVVGQVAENVASYYVDDKALFFKRSKIILNGEEFDWKEDGLVLPSTTEPTGRNAP